MRVVVKAYSLGQRLCMGEELRLESDNGEVLKEEHWLLALHHVLWNEWYTISRGTKVLVFAPGVPR